MSLTENAYRLTTRFPKDEICGMTSQIRRAAASIAANIAEGWGRGTTGEYIHFLMIARGSSMEVETHLIIAAELGYLNEEKLDECQDRIQRIGQMLNRLIQVLKGRGTPRVDRPAKPEARTPNSGFRS